MPPFQGIKLLLMQASEFLAGQYLFIEDGLLLGEGQFGLLEGN
jgi:hypothetical protein